MTSQLRHLKDELQQVDAAPAKHRGPASAQQTALLRRRHKILLNIHDAERAVWGD